MTYHFYFGVESAHVIQQWWRLCKTFP